jgi:hypothetical protein
LPDIKQVSTSLGDDPRDTREQSNRIGTVELQDMGAH